MMKDVFELSTGFFRKSVFLVCTDKALSKFIKKEKVLCPEPPEGMDGMMGVFDTDGGKQVMIVHCNHDAGIVVLVHELSHAVDEVFHHLGVDPGMPSTETRAYLMDSLLEQALEFGYGK